MLPAVSAFRIIAKPRRIRKEQQSWSAQTVGDSRVNGHLHYERGQRRFAG